MKLFRNILLILLFFQFSYSQQNKEFEIIKKRVSKTYFATPEKAKKDAYLLKKHARTNEQINISYQYLGYIYDLTGKSDSARYYFQKRLDFSKEHFYNTITHYQSVIDYTNWGLDFVDRTILIKELTLALSEINKTKYQQETGLMYLLLGDVLLKDGEIDKANNYFDKSFKLIKGKFIAADYYLRKSSIDIIRQDYLSSKSNLLKGLESFKEKDIFTYPLYLNKLGYTSIMLKDYKNAKNYLLQSLYYQEKNGFSNLTSDTYLKLYYLAKSQDDISLQKDYLKKAIVSNQGDIYTLKDIYLGYNDFYSKTGDILKEKESLKKFNQLNDSIQNIEKAKIRTNLEYKFQSKESKKELELKEKIIQKEARITRLYIFVFTIIVFLLIILLLIYFLKVKLQKKLQKNQKLLHEEKLKLMLENQKTEIIKEKIKAKIEERGKLSLELHDGIASEISSLKLTVSNDSLLNTLEIESIVSKIDKLYHEVRNLSHDLDPDNIADIEFSQLVNNLCLLIEKQGIRVVKNILITKKIDNLDENVLLNLYRILQEAFNNIIKHSGASEVQLEIYEDDFELRIFVKDNGIGLQNQTAIKTGIGLKNIKKRVEILQGTYEFSTVEKGTSLLIKIPKKQEIN